MKDFLTKRPVWVAVAAVLILAALIFIRPQTILESAELSVEQVMAYGEDVTDELEGTPLPDLLRETEVSQMMDGGDSWDPEQSLVITGTCDGEAFTLVLGDYNLLNLGAKSYRVRNGSDMLVYIMSLLPEGVA